MNLKTFGYHTRWRSPSGTMNWYAVIGDVIFACGIVFVATIVFFSLTQ